MRKKDFNFVLTKDNVFEFEKRLNRLLMITECLIVNSYYRNKINANSILQSIGITDNILNITETAPCYLVNGKIKYDTYPSKSKLHTKECVGIIIRIHSDSTIVLFFGQKIKFTPSEIIFVKEPLLKKSINSASTTETRIKPFSNLNLALNRIQDDEYYAEQYWKQVESDWDNEFQDF